MSGVIKGDAALSVRSFLKPVPAAPAPTGDPRIEALEREIDALQAALAAQRKESQEAVAAAKAEGERLGKAAADSAAEKQVAALGKGVDAAVAAWRERLDGLEGLTASLAKAALAKLLDERDGHSNFVAEVIARQMRLLRRESLVAVRVSASDFADEAALAALGATAGTGSVRIVADADLEPGDCRIDLQLGHIDIGARTQWVQLAAFLDELAAGENGE